MASPYYVAPLGGLDVGAKIENIIEGGRERRREMDWKEKAPGVIQSGDPGAIAELMLSYPEKIQAIAAASGYKNQQALRDRVDKAKKILSGEASPEEAIGDHVRTLDETGEDPRPVMDQLGKALENPQYGQEWAIKTLALYDPESAQQFMSVVSPGDQYKDLELGYKTYLKANNLSPSPESYAEYQKNIIAQKKAGATNVTTNVGKDGPEFGTIPKGYMLAQDDSGAYTMQPVKGSPAEKEEKQKKVAAKKKMIDSIKKSKVVTDQIDKAVSKVNIFTTGFIGNLMSAIPGTEAYDLGQIIDTVKANVGFDALQKMRDASPTGGALGQVSERELAQLERVIGSLDQAQSPSQLAEMLMQAKTHYNNWKETVQASYDNPDAWVEGRKTTQQEEKPVSEMTDEELQEMAFGGN